VTARYGGVLASLGGMIRGVVETRVLRRYGVGDLGDIGGRGWFVKMGGEMCVIRGVVVPGDAG